MKLNLLLFSTLLLNLYLVVESSRLVAISVGSGHNDVIMQHVESSLKNNVELRLIDTEAQVSKLDQMTSIRNYVSSLKNEKDTIVMLVESGSLFLNSSEEIVKRFKAMEADIVFSASDICQPDPSLREFYPEVPNNERRFLKASGVIGNASVLYEAMKVESLAMIDDSQYYFTKLFLDSELRTNYSIKIDTKSEIFYNLDSDDEVRVDHSEEGEGSLYNVGTGTQPALVQPCNRQIELDSLSNYLGRSWNPVRGCQQCSLRRLDLSTKDSSKWPKVTVAVFIDKATPFLTEFFGKLSQLSYPKSRVNLVVSNMVLSHEKTVRGFVDTHLNQYSTVEYLDASKNITAVDRRTQIIENSKSSADYLLVLESMVHITANDTIEKLISYNKNIVAPLMSRRGQLWSNFWGALGADGYYRRSHDYLDIVNGEKIGIWKVPHINHIYLIKTGVLSTLSRPFAPLSQYQPEETDMIFSGNIRAASLSMWVVNEQTYGYLINPDSATTEHLHNDLWEIFANPEDWKEKYIHPEYDSLTGNDFQLQNFSQPCQDVFWWPLLSETFAKHLIEEMEFFGEWSDGSNKDARLEGGYENVPTRDIHMRQVNWEEHWMKVLKTYVYPMQIKLFQGYYEEPRARMNFVVRYKPTEQDRLRPHHDASSYTLNIALNKPGVDYEGGGAKFNRYDCSVTKSRVGWVLMSPGRVTHLHEGLPTTKGTRYIFVTFINP